MTTKKLLFAFVVLAVGLSLSACVLEYDFGDPAPPWTGHEGAALPNRFDVVGEAVGWQSGRLTVTLDLLGGNIQNVRIVGEHETPSHTRALIQNAERMAEILNRFDFLDGMSGATVTRIAIRDAGMDALGEAGVVFGSND